MIPDRDYYVDKHGKLTDDPSAYAMQVAVRGCTLDERVARRYGITDVLVSTMEPRASRRVSSRNAASVTITRIEDKPEAQPEAITKPQEPAEVVEPKPTAKKEK